MRGAAVLWLVGRAKGWDEGDSQASAAATGVERFESLIVPVAILRAMHD